jgi:hypothetical protein
MECQKLLNEKEFLNGVEGEKILAIAEREAFDFRMWIVWANHRE